MVDQLKGIDPRVFDPNYSEPKTQGLNSGRDLITNVKQDFISIVDSKDETLQFEAKVRNETLIVTVKTRGYQGDSEKRHPDLFAAQLVKKSLQFFELQGHSIHKWKDIWSKSGDLNDNYDQFATYLRTHSSNGRELTQAELVEAAKQTWTGQLANLLEFSKVESIDYRPNIGEVVIVFSKV